MEIGKSRAPQPDFKAYRKEANTFSVKDIFRISKEDLTLFFDKRNMDEPRNQGECRQCLNLLKDCGYMNGLLSMLSTDFKTGIIGSETDLARRARIFGNNKVPLPTISSFTEHWARQFEDSQIIMLIISATIYLFFCLFQEDSTEYLEALAIYSGVVLLTFCAAWAEHQQESQFLKIKDEINSATVTVFRGQYGTESTVKVDELVVGDIISVQQGDIVPADCLLIEEMNIAVDESKYGNGMAVEKEPSSWHDVNDNNAIDLYKRQPWLYDEKDKDQI
jgi:magnesium-transporting ATPase (P-type)